MPKRPTLNFEKLFWGSGCKFVAGVDEAGVAPLAGPVVAAAVILKPGMSLRAMPKINDSKLLKFSERKKLYDRVMDRCLDCSVGVAEVDEIDALNIFHATRLAMKRAVESLKKFDLAVIDGPYTVSGLKCMQFAVVDGDAKIASISAASILAKVTRDEMMIELDAEYPEYGFAKHKGYPTKYHISKVLEHGSSPVHRNSFLGKILQRKLI